MTYWVALLSLAPLISGVIMLVLAQRVAAADGGLWQRGEKAVGTVLAVEQRPDDGGVVGLYPQVRFKTARGRSVKAVSARPVMRALPIEASVQVVYDPDRPQHFLVGPSRARMYRVAGGLFIVIGLTATAVLVSLGARL